MNMRKRIKPLLLSILIIFTIFSVFTGCKIEKPDDVAGKYESSSAYIENTLQNDPAKESTKDAKNKKDSKDKKEGKDKKEADKEKEKDAKSKKATDNKTISANSEGEEGGKEGKIVSGKKSKKNGRKKTWDELVKEANKHRDSGKKDKYLTDPTPEGMPKPVEWQGVKIDRSKVRYCTLSVDCLTILNNMKDFNKDKMSVLPKNGIIYKTRRVMFYEGESVFDMLNREMKKNRIHMEFSMTPIYNSNYIEGIHNLYEFDCGRYSGWMYKVNGWYPNYGCSRYVLKNGDVVNWRYTCDLGRDVGCTWLGKTLDD